MSVPSRRSGADAPERDAADSAANAVVGVHVDYFTAGADNAMLAAIATGTAVVL